MVAVKHLISSPSPQPPPPAAPPCQLRRTNLKNSPSSSSSALILEQRDKSKPLLYLVKEVKVSQKKISGVIHQNEPLRLFLSCGETKLLTLKEEGDLIKKIQDVMKLEQVKYNIHEEPTLYEWAKALGLTSQALKSQLHSGKICREKLIFANFRMVVHIAKQYQGRGLSLADLLQEGSIGLMKSVEKFKPQVGCRFATYAYWWIRQAIRKAIFQHSRTIRLPENVYGLVSKVRKAKSKYDRPTKEEIAENAGIKLEKLNELLRNIRKPISIQKPIWIDQNYTLQGITCDNSIENPDTSVGKELMRKHVRNILNVLSPKEKKIIQLRYGIKDTKLKSLSEIGLVFGLSKERIRQLETRALDKLKQHLGTHGLEAYTDLLI